MRYGKLVAGVPVPTNTKALLDIDGVKYPPSILRDTTFRAAKGIVEIQDQSYDSKYHELGNVTGYTDLGNGVWQEVRDVVPRSVQSLAQKKISEVQVFHDNAVYGGIIYDGNNYNINDSLLIKTIGNRGRARSVTKLITQEGGIVSMTPAQFAAFDTALSDHVNDAHDNLIVHIEAIQLLAGVATQEEMIAYDVSVGWPTNPVGV